MHLRIPRPDFMVIKQAPFPFLSQQGDMDCGAACLAMVCKHHGISVPLDHLRDLAGVAHDGASLAGMARAAERLGFVTQGVRTSYEGLRRKTLPAIVHWQGRHFVVLYGITKGEVRLADPAVGLRRLSREAFAADWTGVALLVMQPFESHRV